ncbi:MAG: 16S rRNA (cytosine(1402)-N(4))-methyltransferase RsmH [Deltaproteobacteria bacterium]|nr:16S rRNA (cytosine(1402)-N(4))-methyltransferase RsmH [Deltaproteobacteria bacterium]
MGLAHQFSHVPVMLTESLDLLAITPGGRYCDGTAGGAGHSLAILERSAPGGLLLAVDRDPEAIAICKERLASSGPRATLVKGNYADLNAILEDVAWPPLDGVLLDLGVSSRQLDTAARGFSFSQPGPIDMRMGPDAPQTAHELMDALAENDLANLIYELGEERKSRRVARAIKKALTDGALANTADLARVVASAVGGHGSQRIHPATRTFQALRIAVNDELGGLDRFLDTALDLVRIGGRVAVIAFHSLEDRRVKRRFAALAGHPAPATPSGAPPLPIPEEKPEPPRARLLTKRAVQATEEETARNPRARSARLRGLERLL